MRASQSSTSRWWQKFWPSRPVTRLSRGRASYENPAVSLTDPEALASLFGIGQAGSTGVTVNARTSLSYSPVWSAVWQISNDIAMIPTYVYRRTPDGGKERAVGHSAYRLLRRRASTLLTANVWKQQMMVQALLEGNAYARIVRDGTDRPQELLILNASGVRPMVKDGELWYEHTDGVNRQLYHSIDVFHLRGLVFDELNGLSLVEFAREAFGRGIATSQFAGRFFRDGTVVSGILTHPHRLKPEAANRLRESWQGLYSGVSKAHRVAILEEGMQFIQAGIDPEKAQMINTLEFSVKDVARMFAIPPHRLGDDSRTSFNSVEQENLSYQQSTLGPWFHKIREEAFDKLLSEEEKANETITVEELRNTLLAADAKTRHEVYSIGLQNGFYSRDEIRAMENMNPIEGGEGKAFFMPLNMSVTGQAVTASQSEGMKDDDEARIDPVPVQSSRFTLKAEVNTNGHGS